MATKKITLKGGQLIDTNTESVGWVADDTSGLHFIPGETESGGPQTAYSTLTHMVTETNNPIWNRVSIKYTPTLTASENLNFFVTLQGIKPDGTIQDIMEKSFNATETTSSTTIFDLLGSSCTNDMYSQTRASSAHDAGTIQVDLPMRYGKYEEVDLVGAWFDRDWGYRQALPIERSNGQLHGVPGHNSDYYGRTIYVPYTANMSSTTQDDVRFTGPDGVTELPFFQLDVVDSTSAVYIVMIPWGFLDKENETFRYGTYDLTTYDLFNFPQHIYVYYGNANATSASDVTLGGHALFYDDFSSDLGWTFGGAANTTEVIENGYLELRSAASQTSTASAYRNADFSGSDSTSWEIIFKIIYDTPAYTNTTPNNGPILRIRGRNNTGSGGADETDSRWQARHYYVAAGAGESGANPAGHMWAHEGVDSGVNAYGPLYANNLNCAVSDTQYMRARWSKRDSTGTNDMTWAHSDDGVNWNTLGDFAGLTTIFDTVTDLQIGVIYVGSNGVAADKYIRLDAIMAYPIMTGTEQKIYWEESFQNGIYLDRYGTINRGAARIITETQDLIKFENTAGTGCYWNTTTKTPLILYLGGGLDVPVNTDREAYVYECTFVNTSKTARAGVGELGGICLFDNATLTSANACIFNVWYRHTGPIRNFRVTTLRSGTVDVDESMGSWVDADLPIKLRIVFDPRTKSANFDIRRVGSGGDWERIYTNATIYTDMIADTYTMIGLNYRTSTTDASWVTMSKLKFYNGGPDIESGKECTTSAWQGEESYADDYPLVEHIAASEDDLSVYFDIPSPMPNGTPMQLRTKDFGGDYNYSKPFLLIDDDTISIGPSGTDQYIGLRLVFDGTFDDEDEFEISEINFEYEVI